MADRQFLGNVKEILRFRMLAGISEYQKIDVSACGIGRMPIAGRVEADHLALLAGNQDKTSVTASQRDCAAIAPALPGHPAPQ